ncbi:hypothetical protein Q604_UNBC07833G0001 [human gut metagenome]|uniref:Uncharacterized protein n=1 Tax=human gut metagenome TaxID=408170 RepID=W1YA22_9ZZZZ|nr:hypothetical protein [Intestinibacter bartlettii]SCI39117.1 Uncharacterised protein [uncultured Clostridium sp.]
MIKKKKYLIIFITIIVIFCFTKLIITFKNNSLDDVGNYNIEVGSDMVTIETPKEQDIKPIGATSTQILSDFAKNKEKALEKYEYKKLTLEIVECS